MALREVSTQFFDQELSRLSSLDRAYNRNMVAVAHTKRGEQSAADTAAQNLPLIQAAAARTINTTADAFKATIDGKTVTTRGDATEARRALAGKPGHRLMNLYGYDKLEMNCPKPSPSWTPSTS